MPEFARLSTLEVDTHRVNDAVGFFNNTDLRGASSAKGFRRGFWLLDRSTGKGVELVVFESKEALDAAGGEESAARSNAQQAGVKLAAEQVYEVVAEGRHTG